MEKKFSVEQIVSLLKQSEVGVPVAELDPQGRYQRARVLSLEGEVCWPRGRSGPPDEAAARREHTAQATGRGADAG